jgi:ribonuclease HII
MIARARARWVVGIDEVGRGALAGPVMVAAAMLAVDARGRIAHAPFRSLKDSKKLTAPRREFWAAELRANAGVRFAIARIYPRGIDRLNISAAANRAALNAFVRLSRECALPPHTEVRLDGGLFLGSKVGQRKAVANKAVRAKTVIKGDEKFPAVAAASILAKVSRDRFMTRLAKRYPGYGFDVHKGYGTAAHMRALQKNGRCPAHRLTFLVKRPTINR